MGIITENLYKQIKGWRVYSIIAPAVFTAVSAFLYIFYGTPFQIIFYVGLVILSITCISWWHWSLSSMLTMLSIMKDTDDHFEQVQKELKHLRDHMKPDLRVIKTVDYRE